MYSVLKDKLPYNLIRGIHNFIVPLEPPMKWTPDPHRTLWNEDGTIKKLNCMVCGHLVEDDHIQKMCTRGGRCYHVVCDCVLGFYPKDSPLREKFFSYYYPDRFNKDICEFCNLINAVDRLFADPADSVIKKLIELEK